MSASFNTSHVVVYPVRLVLYHLRSRCFNTSHVVVYQLFHLLMQTKIQCFNTSHVVVYRRIESRTNHYVEFQYISCCSLSKEIFQLYKSNISFNTSHVVVYPHIYMRFVINCFLIFH